MRFAKVRARLVLVVLAVSLLALGCASSGVQTSYDDSVKENFLDGCDLALDLPNEDDTISGGAEEVCGCAYEEISATVPFEDFRILDERLRDDVGLLAQSPLPAGSTEARLVNIISACIRGS